MEGKERLGHWRIKRGWNTGMGGALEDKERVGHWRIKKRVGIGE